MAIAPFNPNVIEALVFDVDDTITRGTLAIKHHVFAELFADKRERLAAAKALYEDTGAGDRYNIIAHVLDEPQADCHSNPAVQAVVDQFATQVEVAIRKVGIHPDDRAALTALKAAYAGCIYVLSAAPAPFARANFDYFYTAYPELTDLVNDFYDITAGGGKAAGLQQIAEVCECDLAELVMIGDGGSDYRGATEAGTQFIGIVPKGKDDPWPTETFPKLPSIATLPSLLNL